MSHLSKEELFDRVIQAIAASGWEERTIARTHPFQLLLSHDDVSLNVRVYIWNITHGGGSARAPDEYRIQLTGVSNIETAASYRTLLIGWDERYHVFAGWNASRYETFGSSPSLQVKEGTLVNAAEHGLSIQPKETDAQGNVTEVVVAFRPDFFGVYAENLDKYHQPQLSRREAVLLERVATPRPPTDEELASLSEERRHVIREIQQAVRNSRFRRIVIGAYDYRCAICGLNLGIVHAAHIIPVEEKGTDEADNGIALCPNHHAAFDRDIIIIRDNYSIVLNHSRTAELPRLLSNVQTLTVPQDTRLQPRPEYLRQRIRSRGLTLALH